MEFYYQSLIMGLDVLYDARLQCCCTLNVHRSVMSDPKYSFDNVFSFFASAFVNWLMGMAAIVSMVVLFGYAWAAYEHYQKIQTLDVSDTGRIHVYFGHTPSQSYTSVGPTVMCYVYETSTSKTWQEKLNVDPGFCQKISDASNTWEDKLRPQKSSFWENLFWSVLITPVFLFGGFMFARMIAGLIVIVVSQWTPYYYWVVLVCMTPVFVAIGAFLYMAWQGPVQDTWMYNGYMVKTHPVYYTTDGNVYTRPTTMLEWTESSKAGMELTPAKR